jgi:hypothetical protein
MRCGPARAEWILLSLLVLFPGNATAQTRVSPPRVSIGAGAGVALPFHGDFDFTPWAWEADVRVRLSRRMLFEAAVGDWRHSETRVVANIPVTTPPGVIGRLEQTTARTQRTFEANALFTGGSGRVRVNAGGGVGLLQHSRRTRQITGQCSPGVSCGSSESTFSNAVGAAQAVGGAEARLSDGFNVYGQVRFVVPMTDPGGSDFRVTAGVRWSLGY